MMGLPAPRRMLGLLGALSRMAWGGASAGAVEPRPKRLTLKKATKRARPTARGRGVIRLSTRRPARRGRIASAALSIHLGDEVVKGQIQRPEVQYFVGRATVVELFASRYRFRGPVGKIPNSAFGLARRERTAAPALTTATAPAVSPKKTPAGAPAAHVQPTQIGPAPPNLKPQHPKPQTPKLHPPKPQTSKLKQSPSTSSNQTRPARAQRLAPQGGPARGGR